MRKFSLLTVALALVPSVAFSKGDGHESGAFHDGYSKSSELDLYTPDRSAARQIALAKVDGRKGLQLTVGYDVGNPDPFYNFQGYVRWANTAHTATLGLASRASLSVDIYVPSSWKQSVLRGADLWARIDDPAYDAGHDPYPTAGFYNYGDGAGVAFSIFEGYSGEIVDYYDVKIKYDDWNRVSMTWDASGVSYFLNKKLIHHDSAPEYASCLALEAAFLQGWRAGGLGADYDVYFDDLKGQSKGDGKDD